MKFILIFEVIVKKPGLSRIANSEIVKISPKFDSCPTLIRAQISKLRARVRSHVTGTSSLFANILQAICWLVVKYDRKLKLNGSHKINGQRALCDVEVSSLIVLVHLFGYLEDFKKRGSPDNPATRNRW